MLLEVYIPQKSRTEERIEIEGLDSKSRVVS